MNKIEIKNIKATYKHNNNIFTALDDVSLSVREGEFVCIVGNSGCGKSTLLQVLSGLMRASAGQVVIAGKPVIGPGPDRTMVFQQYSLFPWMTAKKNVMFGLEQVDKTIGKKEIERRAEYYLEKVDMLSSVNKYPSQLSGGMRQRVAIARALAIDSEILLMDEPFGALDTKTRSTLQNLLTELWQSGKEKKTVVFVTHDIDEAILLADKIVFMTPGKIAEVIDVLLPRPRIKNNVEETDEFKRLKNELKELFYKHDGNKS